MFSTNLQRIVLMGAMGVASAAAWGQVVVTTGPATQSGRDQAMPQPVKRAEVRAANDLTPTLLTIHKEKVAVAEVLCELSGQLGREYYIPAMVREWGNFPLVSVQAEKQPYWDVALALEDKLYGTCGTGFDGRLMIGMGQRFDPAFRQVTGVFVVTVIGVGHDVSYMVAPEKRVTCGVQLAVRAEPHVKMMTYVPVCVPEVAVDEQGNSLVPKGNVKDAVVAFAPERDKNVIMVRLAPPAEHGRKIARLKGALTLTVPAEVKTLAIDSLGAAETCKEELNGAALTFTASEERLTLAASQGSYSQWLETKVLLDCIRVLATDQAGVTYLMVPGGGSGGAMSLTTTYTPHISAVSPANGEPRPGKAVKYQIVYPLGLKEVTIPFEFRDLPLP